MLKEDVIKKVFDHVDVSGFCFERGHVIHNGTAYRLCSFKTWNISKTDNWVFTVYPLLLQRIVEGINRDDNCDFWIEQICLQVSVNINRGEYILYENMPIDQAKEQAIIYISGSI